jgi:hypothetical protein
MVASECGFNRSMQQTAVDAAPATQLRRLERALFSSRVTLAPLDLLIGAPRVASPSVASRHTLDHLFVSRDLDHGK